MQIEEITIVTHFGQNKSCDCFVRTADGRNLAVGTVWTSETIDEQEATQILQLFAGAIKRATEDA